MKRSAIVLLLLSLTILSYAQVRSAYGKDGYYLTGNMAIYMKNQEVINGEFVINNVKFLDSDIDYRDVDFIIQNKERYEFVNTGKSKPQLLKAYYHYRNMTGKRGRVMFYQSIPKMYSNINQQLGTVKDTYISNHFMLKDDMDVAVKFKSYKAGDLIKKYFSDCPALMELYNDKKKRSEVTHITIFHLYNNGCGAD